MKKILVIDDDESILEAVGILLESEGYEVMKVVDASNAIKKVEEFRPDLILLDYLISGEVGTDITEKIRSTKDYCDIPVVLMSAHPKAHMSASKCGANCFIAKPFDIDELIKIVEVHTS